MLNVDLHHRRYNFCFYIGIAIWTRAGSTKEFYVAEVGFLPYQWHGYRHFLRLDVSSLIYLDGRSDLIYGLRWSRLPHGMDRRIRLAGLYSLRPYLRKFGKFMHARLLLVTVLFQYCAYGSRSLCHHRFLYLCSRTDERCWRCIFTLLKCKYWNGRGHRHDHRIVLRCSGRYERYHLYPGSTILYCSS